MFAEIAQALAAIDPARAAQLIADAERTTESITGKYAESFKADALAEIAKALAATDPGRSDRVHRFLGSW